MFDPTDFGIVFSQAGGSPSSYYLDIKGVTQQVEALSSAFTPMQNAGVESTAQPFIARTLRQELEIRATFDQVSLYRVRVMTRRDAGPWVVIGTVRSDTQTLATTHDITAGQLTTLLQTPAGTLRDQMRVEVQAVWAVTPTSADTLQVLAKCA